MPPYTPRASYGTLGAVPTSPEHPIWPSGSLSQATLPVTHPVSRRDAIKLTAAITQRLNIISESFR